MSIRAATTQVIELFPPLSPPPGQKSLDVVVGVGSATQAEADHDAAAAQQDHAEEDVDQSRDPEGEQVERLVAVKLRVRGVLGEFRHVNRVDPHIAWKKQKTNKRYLHSVLFRDASKQPVQFHSSFVHSRHFCDKKIKTEYFK